MGADEAGIGRKDAEEFESWRSFWTFRQDVARNWRYVRSPQSQRFLAALAIGSRSRSVDVAAGRHFYRSQVAHRDEEIAEIEDTIPGAALPERMTPFRDRATEGRVNPKGIPCLYLASDEHTAMAEARPWIGSLVSVGLFRVTRLLRLVDCTRDADLSPIYIEGEPSPERRTQAVWAHVAAAFREPVTRDDNLASYAATQVIAETFRAEGFDGLAYRSAFGTDRYNLALFDLDAAELVMCQLHEVQDVEMKHRQIANPYYMKKRSNGGTDLMQNLIVDIAPVSGPTKV